MEDKWKMEMEDMEDREDRMKMEDGMEEGRWNRGGTRARLEP
jgi:hypothetical protein